MTLVRAARAKTPTVNEVVLLPGDTALMAEQWVPWADRIQPGDVTAGLLMPTAPEDPRLEPGYTGGEQAADTDPAEASEIRAVVAELGLGRERVLSREGRDEAAERWLASDGGPDNEMTRQAPDVCETCGFFARIDGLARRPVRRLRERVLPVRRPRRQRRPRLRRALRRGRGEQGRGAAGPGLGDHRLGRAHLPVRLTTGSARAPFD